MLGCNQESLEALAAHDKERLRETTLAYIRRHAEKGATADEVCAALEMPHNSIAPRVTELKAQGLIVELYDRANRRVRRKTRQGCAAGVVIAAEFANTVQKPVTRSLFGELAPERYPD